MPSVLLFIQNIPCRLFSVYWLLKPMVAICHLQNEELSQVEIYLESNIYHPRSCIWKWCNPAKLDSVFFFSNALAPKRYGCNIKWVIMKLISSISILSITSENIPRYMSQYFSDAVRHQSITLTNIDQVLLRHTSTMSWTVCFGSQGMYHPNSAPMGH